MRSTLRLLLVVLIASAGLASANLLTNGDFETEGVGGTGDADGWFRTHTELVQRWAEAGQPGHGDWMMLRQDNDPNWHWASQKVAATAGLEYAVSAEFKAVMQPGETVILRMHWLDSGGGEIGVDNVFYDSSHGDYLDWGWVSRSVTAFAPAGTAEVEVRVQSLSDGLGDSAIFVDNVTLDVIPEPATLGLFGLIGGGMLWVRKRSRS